MFYLVCECCTLCYFPYFVFSCATLITFFAYTCLSFTVVLKVFPNRVDTDLYIHAAVVCGTDFPVSLMSTHNMPSIRTYGTVVQYDCLEGYRFKPGIYRENVTCAKDGSWEPDIGDCEGSVREREVMFKGRLLYSILLFLVCISTSETCLSCELTETQCPVLHTWTGLVSVTSNISYRANVNVTCKEGSHFPNAMVYLESYCTAMGEWDPFIPDCIRKNVLLMKFVMWIILCGRNFDIGHLCLFQLM